MECFKSEVCIKVEPHPIIRLILWHNAHPDLISSDASAINCPNGAIRVTEHDSLERALKMTCILQQQQSKRDGRTAAMQSKWFPPFVTATKEILSERGIALPLSLPAPTLLRKTNSDKEGIFQLWRFKPLVHIGGGSLTDKKRRGQQQQQTVNVL